MLGKNINNRSFLMKWTALLSGMMMLYGQQLQAQVISTSGAYISVTSGTVVVADTIVLDATTTLDNSGAINFSTLTNNGTVQGNGVYNLTGDFTNNSTFTSNSGTVTFNGTAAQTIGGTASTTFNNLTINNFHPASAIILGIAQTVNGALTLTDGHIITTSANLLTMGTAATLTLNAPITQDSSFVKGPMAYTVNVSTAVTKIYPIGKSNSYRRADLTVTQGFLASTIYTAEMFNSSAVALGYALPATLTHVSNIRYTQIDQSPIAAVTSAQVRLYFSCSDSDDVVQDLPNLAIAKDNGAGAWLDLSGSSAGVLCSGTNYAGDILSGTFTTFSKFSLANKTGDTPLPIELLSFTANCNNHNVILKWITATETNNDYFTIERSTDGKTFVPIGTIKGAGNSSTIKNYYFTDNKTGTVFYYRLKQTDFDGQFKYFQIIAVRCNDAAEFTLYPNPSYDGAFIIQGAAQNSDVIVTDVLGKIILRTKITGEKTEIDLSNHLSGIYFIQINSGYGFASNKIIVNK